MTPIREYHRAKTLEEARKLHAGGAVFLGGGTRLVSSKPKEVTRVVDVSGLGLDKIGSESIGATARLQAVLEAPDTPEVLRDALRGHLPATWRNAATAAGECVFGGSVNDWLVALLALDARYVVDGKEVAVGKQPSGLVSEIRYRRPEAAVFMKVSRLKTDKAVVNVAAARFDGKARLVLGGVAENPLVLAGPQLPELNPPADFRGSADYRRHLAGVLAKRAWAALEAAA